MLPLLQVLLETVIALLHALAISDVYGKKGAIANWRPFGTKEYPWNAPK